MTNAKSDREGANRATGQGAGGRRLRAEALTWAALLGRWIEFAQSAVALPRDAAGRRVRASVPDMIMLQAVWFALEHVDELDPAHRALGVTRAAVLIDKHATALTKRWGRSRLPAALRELIDDARAQLQMALGVE